MRILLAGASGLIGSEILNKLKEKYIVKSLGLEKDSDYVVDLNKIHDIENQSFANFDIFIHCAGITDEEFRANPLKSFQRSTYLFSQLTDKVLDSGIKIIIYFSTSHVYGTFNDIIDEDTPVNPLSDYAIAHYAAEQILKRSPVQEHTKVFVFRPNAVYGIPKYLNRFRRWQLIPYSFPLECVYNQKIVLKSSGNQKRNFVSTQDIAGYIEAILSNLRMFNDFTIINPVGQETISVYEFAERCCEIYENLFNKKCLIIRPVHLENDVFDSFEFKTRYKFYKFKCNVKDYLESFILNISKDLNRNIIYNTIE